MPLVTHLKTASLRNVSFILADTRHSIPPNYEYRGEVHRCLVGSQTVAQSLSARCSSPLRLNGEGPLVDRGAAE